MLTTVEPLRPLQSTLRTRLLSVVLLAATLGLSPAAENESAGPTLEKFHPKKAPKPPGLVLREGDRLAICGDSITEQKMYSRIMETYLTVSVPELDVTTRQYGWGGETASGFLARMTNDVLRFKPTIATTCYGMNDHQYRPYEKSIGDTYRAKSSAIVRSFKENGVRVIHGSPGCVGKRPGWSKDTNSTLDALNLNLCELRNIGVEIAESESTGFADVFWPMLTASYAAQERYGTNYAVAGNDGVHPGWSGHLIMAYAFLKSFGLDGEIGTFTVDMKSHEAEASKGHEIVSFKEDELKIKSSKYPFCAAGDRASDKSIRSGMTLVPFNKELNRLMLVVKNGKAENYKIIWGETAKIYSAEQLGRGINLAEDFEINPFSDPFARVDKAVIAKQTYETKQIKQIFHELGAGKWKSADAIKDEEMRELYEKLNRDGKLDMDALAAETEKKRAPLAAAIKTAFVPVTHTLRIEAQ